jgi:DNA-binding GntR family transcriptional regulator
VGDVGRLHEERGGKFRTRRLSENVAGDIRERIVSAQLMPGDFIRTEPLADELGVSNTPVREALLLLRSEGFVELVPRRGFMVSTFTREDVRDLFWVQATLAGELASRAARRIDESTVAELDRLVREHVEAISTAGNPEHVMELGHQFHRTVNLAANSRRMTLLLGGIVGQLPNRFYHRIDGHLDETVRDHPSILEAIRNGRAEQAGELMRQHLLSGADPLIATLEQLGIWSDDGAAEN